MNRRELMIGLGAAGLVAALPARSRAQEDEAEPSEPGAEEGPVEYLFVQSAQEVTLANGRLEMKGVTPATLFFSDRPERITGHAATDTWVKQWGFGEDSFGSNPPNAALSILDDAVIDEIVVVLKSPQLKSGNLVYRVDVLEGPTEASGGPGSLFIDVIGRPMTPVSIAGRHRRVRRRRRRAIRD